MEEKNPLGQLVTPAVQSIQQHYNLALYRAGTDLLLFHLKLPVMTKVLPPM